jgi:hypothetical protein
VKPSVLCAPRGFLLIRLDDLDVECSRPATGLFTCATTGRDRKAGSQDWRYEVNPEVFEVIGDESGSK